ncbi:13E12 repeat family protein, partial [Gordonia amicalis]
MFDGADPASLSDDALERRVLGYAAQITALTAEFLSLVAELDERQSWRGPGVHSLAHWMSWKAGVSQRTAQEQIRVAKALTELPLIREAFGAGRLSYSKVRALTRVATSLREKELVNLALSCTASQLERAVRVSFATAMGPPGLPRGWDHLGALLRMLCGVGSVKSGSVSLA